MLHNFKDKKIKVAIKPYFEEDCKKIVAGQKPGLIMVKKFF